ncbi:hypothetical protein KWH46_00745, partial [Escherichia coli]|uniref:hypothetical protein n=1 Tax=Escherichia coli TaxID=562 RepID=UPI0021D35C27
IFDHIWRFDTSSCRRSSSQHRFHAVAMSAHGKPGIMRIFDHIWRFDTGMRSRLLRRWRR